MYCVADKPWHRAVNEKFMIESVLELVSISEDPKQLLYDLEHECERGNTGRVYKRLI